MFKFIATAVLALSAFSAQSAICYYCTANGAAEHGLMEVQAPGKNCPARGCTGVDEPNGIADHGTIFWRQDLPGLSLIHI